MLSHPPLDSSYNTAIERACVMGASGLIGTALCRSLSDLGVSVTAYSRGHVSGDMERAHWDPHHGEIDTAPLKDCDAVINLAGESLVAGRWNPERKERLLRSRVQSTQLLARTLSQLDQKPRVLINASAVGYYGDRGEDAVFETSEPGQGFLADLCRAWEEAAEPVKEVGIRLVTVRMGMVLSREGGALSALLPLFRMGLGGKLGRGQQFFPWITLHDAVRAIRFLVACESISGPVNLVAPEPTRNAEFVAALGEILGRPTVVPVPRMALRLLLGEAANEVLLGGANVRPAVLERAGFRFDYPRLDDALQAVLHTSL